MKNPKFFIAAPFGNYIKPKGCIPVTGTFTLEPRGNRFWAIMKTLRYNKEVGGWTNKLGLPNPGIKVGLQKTNRKNEILSIEKIESNNYITFFPFSVQYHR